LIKILHFADAHIDMARSGKQDAESGLPLRALDFLAALDAIVDAAVREPVDLVLFAGDAYRDRTPAPTFQREWGRRMMRLSQASIPTLLITGNHDVPPTSGRAHALQEYETLAVAHVQVVSKPSLLKPADLEGLPLQIIALPWPNRSALLAALGLQAAGADITTILEEQISSLVNTFLNQLDPSLPALLLAHGSVAGAVYGNERSVMLGHDWLLPASLVKDPRLDYAALGHIHKYQDLNPGSQPPVVYPGSIERLDFGEMQDEKGYVLVRLEKGSTSYERRVLNGRRFYSQEISFENAEQAADRLENALSLAGDLDGVLARLILDYPRELESLIDEPALRQKAAAALEFHLIRRPRSEARLRLPADQRLTELPPQRLLELYWQAVHAEQPLSDELAALASDIFQTTAGGTPQEPGA